MKTRWKKQVFTTQNQVIAAVTVETLKQKEQLRKEIEEEIFLIAARQIMAIVLYTLHLNGWGKKRLRKIFEDIAQIYNFMDKGIMNGVRFDGDDCIKFIAEKYDIDVIKEMSTEIIRK